MDDFNARDLFAGLAMCGMMAEGDDLSHKTIAELAYEMADAMLKEREKRDVGEPTTTD